MKALPLWQPWATLVAIGAKRVETRDYAPQRVGLYYGQRIAIHATRTTRELHVCDHEPFSRFVRDSSQLPLGAIVATCRLDRASEITVESAEQLFERNLQEFEFGNYEPGRWAWVLKDVEQLAEPVPFRGSQGTFDVPDQLRHRVRPAALARPATRRALLPGGQLRPSLRPLRLHLRAVPLHELPIPHPSRSVVR